MGVGFKMRTVKYFALGLILGIGLTWSWFSCSIKNRDGESALPALTAAQEQAPFGVMYNYYLALSEGKEDQLAELVTSDFWNTMKNTGLLQTWQQRRKQDPSLRFVIFLLKEQEADFKIGTAWARGSAEWVSAREGKLSIPQTVTLLKVRGTWRIKDIKEQG